MKQRSGLLLALCLLGPLPCTSLRPTTNGISPSPTSAVEYVYTSPRFGWSVSVPPGWTTDDTDDTYVQIRNPSADALCGVHTGDPRGLSLDEFTDDAILFTEDYFARQGRGVVVLSREEYIHSSGLPANLVVVHIEPDLTSFRHYVAYREFVVVIDCETWIDNWRFVNADFEAIASSFSISP